MSRRIDDYYGRAFLPDVYPRKDDPFQPRGALVSSLAPGASLGAEGQPAASTDVYSGWITDPGTRPVVYQRAINYTISAGVTPIPLSATQFQCDTIVLDVFSTAANSVFFGFGSGISVNSGIEVQPGLPVVITPDNNREQWELQRILEAIAAMLGQMGGFPALGPFKSPRVVFDANDYFVVATATTAVSVMLFNVPQFQ